MRKKLKYLLACMSTFVLVYSNQLTVFAAQKSDTGNAVEDIMNDERFNGAISTISWLTGFIDHYMTMAITLVAFFIISAALLKNVCAAAYCSNSKFWNKVAEAHEAAAAQSISGIVKGLRNVPNMNLGGKGGISQALLCIVPNIKAMTDFDDVDMEPKHYWMKAIPQMLACIIIGVFVYNGYYRDTAGLVGNMGSVVIERALSSVDPNHIVDVITTTHKPPENIYANDPTTVGQMNYEISEAIYKACKGDWKISDQAQETSLMRNSEYMASVLTSFTGIGVDSASSPFKCAESLTNKVMSLSGLSVTTVGAVNNGASTTALTNAPGWYGPSGDTGDGSVAFKAAGDTGFTFQVYAPGPKVNNATVGDDSTNSWIYVTGTLTQVDGDQKNQDSSIVAQVGTFSGSTVNIDPVNATVKVAEGVGTTDTGSLNATTHQAVLKGLTDQFTVALSDDGQLKNINSALANAAQTALEVAYGEGKTVSIQSITLKFEDSLTMGKKGSGSVYQYECKPTIVCKVTDTEGNEVTNQVPCYVLFNVTVTQ